MTTSVSRSRSTANGRTPRRWRKTHFLKTVPNENRVYATVLWNSFITFYRVTPVFLKTFPRRRVFFYLFFPTLEKRRHKRYFNTGQSIWTRLSKILAERRSWFFLYTPESRSTTTKGSPPIHRFAVLCALSPLKIIIIIRFHSGNSTIIVEK